MEKVNMREKFALFSEHWRPKIVGELNGQHVKLVKFAGPFAWHHHDEEDELFLVVRGWFTMEFRDRNVRLEAGEFLIVPRGVEHRPVAEEEVEVLLFEPVGTLNTGNVRSELTAEKLEELCSNKHLFSKTRGALQPKFLPVLAQADQSGTKDPEHQKLIIEIAMLRHSQVREDIRKHEDRQTQAYNFAIGVYGAELVAASTAVTMALQALNGNASLALDDLACCVLPVFQIVFPALMFSLWMLYLDVSLFNQVAHRQARKQLLAVINEVDSRLTTVEGGPDFIRVADVLKEEYNVSLDRIWMFKHLMFLYASFLGGALAVLAYYLVHRSSPQSIFYSTKLNLVIGFGTLLSSGFFWATLTGLLASHRVRVNPQGSLVKKAPLGLERILRPWSSRSAALPTKILE